MNIKDIKKYKWNISDNLNISYNPERFISKEEQECHFNILKQGYNSDQSEIMVCCSFQEYLTKLSKSEYFTVTDVLVHKKSGFLLQVMGVMGNKSLIIRRSIVSLSKQEKKRRADSLRKYTQKKRL
jgi:hypothetical protein